MFHILGQEGCSALPPEQRGDSRSSRPLARDARWECALGARSRSGRGGLRGRCEFGMSRSTETVPTAWVSCGITTATITCEAALSCHGSGSLVPSNPRRSKYCVYVFAQSQSSLIHVLKRKYKHTPPPRTHTHTQRSPTPQCWKETVILQ